MRAALVGAVYFNADHFKAQHFDCVIAVDRGYASLRRAGIAPDVAVGDFDSLGFAPDCPTRTFPVEKDASDMELAMREALERGADEVLLYGAFSARLDHTLANVQMLCGYAQRGVRVFGIGDAFAITALAGGAGMPSRTACLSFNGRMLQAAGLAQEGHANDPVHSEDDLPEPVREGVAAPGAYGNFVSVFAFCGTAHDVSENGLKYGLAHADLPDTTSRGLSNEFTASDAHIRVGDGTLVVTFPLPAWDALER